MPGRPTNLHNGSARAYSACVRYVRSCLEMFSLISLWWSGGAMVLGKLPVPGRPTNLDYSMARAYCTCSRCIWGVVWKFFSRLSFLSSFSPPLEDCPIWTEILSQRAVNPKTTNRPNHSHFFLPPPPSFTEKTHSVSSKF